MQGGPAKFLGSLSGSGQVVPGRVQSFASTAHDWCSSTVLYSAYTPVLWRPFYRLEKGNTADLSCLVLGSVDVERRSISALRLVFMSARCGVLGSVKDEAELSTIGKSQIRQSRS